MAQLGHHPNILKLHAASFAGPAGAHSVLEVIEVPLTYKMPARAVCSCSLYRLLCLQARRQMPSWSWTSPQ